MSISITAPRRLGYVTLGVRDMAEALDFWTRQVHLRTTYADDSVAYLTGGRDHHWIVLEQATEIGMKCLAYELDSTEELVLAQDRLKTAGIETHEASDRGIANAIDFRDPDGLPLRLYAGMAHNSAPRHEGWVNHAELLHVGLSVSDVQRSFEFYSGILGLQTSDWVERMGVFLRANNGFHHALVLLERGEPRLEHICFQMRSFDDLMRARELLLSKGVALKTDLIRHAPSNSVAIYTNALPTGLVAEMCIWHDHIDSSWRPRTLVRSPWAANVWTPPADIDTW
jgi:catechol-2,3-dioxygenase